MWRDRFRAKGLATPELDARLIAEHALGLDRLELVNRERQPIGDVAGQRLDQLGARRLAGEPVARILGEKEFWGLTFQLNSATLVPRPETEALIELGIAELSDREAPRLLDLGTGSGCIPIALLTELPAAEAVAVDLDAHAIAAAGINAKRHKVAERLSLRQGSWFAPIVPGETFDLVVSNPPYIESAEIGTLAREVRDHDPLLALDGGADGLDAYRDIVRDAPAVLREGGMLALEIGSAQARPVMQLLERRGFSEIALSRDLAGHDRVISGRWR